LIETMRVSDAGEVYLLERHLNRLHRSARHFQFTCNLERVREQVLDAAALAHRPACLRLTLAIDGVAGLEIRPLPIASPRQLKLSSVRVDSKDQFLYHKTSNRGIYDEARRECGDSADVILSNERGEITETTIMNIAVLRNGQWITPRVSCGLLPGVMREELLVRGEIVEGVIPAADLRNGELIRGFNALRGVCEAVLCL
jgi:para-aminobenzoate synthetase/4-amino-4-deoxychorismate lyase